MPNKKSYINIKKCRLCDSVALNSFINFDTVALGNNLQSDIKKAEMADEYPLEVLNCQSCNHFQLSCSVSPEILYATNYTYLSGIGKGVYSRDAMQKLLSLVYQAKDRKETILLTIKSQNYEHCRTL